MKTRHKVLVALLILIGYALYSLYPSFKPRTYTAKIVDSGKKIPVLAESWQSRGDSIMVFKDTADGKFRRWYFEDGASGPDAPVPAHTELVVIQ